MGHIMNLNEEKKKFFKSQMACERKMSLSVLNTEYQSEVI